MRKSDSKLLSLSLSIHQRMPHRAEELPFIFDNGEQKGSEGCFAMVLINSLAELTTELRSWQITTIDFILSIRFRPDYYHGVKIKGKTLRICER